MTEQYKVPVEALIELLKAHRANGQAIIDRFDDSDEWRTDAVGWAAASSSVMDLQKHMDRSGYVKAGVYSAFDDELLDLMKTTLRMRDLYHGYK